MAFDFKALSKNDQGLLVAGAATTLLTFFPSYAKASVKVKGEALTSIGGSASHNAWTEWATFGVLLVIAAFVVVVLKVVAGATLPDGVPWNLVIAAAAGLGTILLILYVFTFGDDVPSIAASTVDVSTGPGWSGWLLIIASIAFSVFAFLGFKESGEKIPEIKKNGGTPPAA